MKTRNTPDERVVYLALRKIFKGPEAKLRQPRAILKVLEKHREQMDVANLMRSYHINGICSTVQTLLSEEIFESPLKAMNRFPDMFAPLPMQVTETQASKAVTVRSEVDATRDAAKHSQKSVGGGMQIESKADTDGGEQCTVDAVELTPNKLPVTVETRADSISPIVKRSKNMAPLFPVYLPFRTQHRVLAKVQLILEYACFEFAQQTMPEILIHNHWDCPESVELSAWAIELPKLHCQLANKNAKIGKPLNSLCNSAANLRHMVVHRVRISAKGVEEFIRNAELLATLLGDEARLSLLTRLRQDTQSAIEELERNKHILSSKLMETLESIAMQRAGLDGFEKTVLSEIVKEDTEYQMIAGGKLEQAVESLEARV